MGPHTQAPAEPMQVSTRPVLEIDGLHRDFLVRNGRFAKSRLQAVAGVSLSIGRGETLGLVGESGSGKSTLARLAAGLLKPTAGAVRLDGQDTWSSHGEARKRTGAIQMVFQNPASSMDPRWSIGDSIAEPARRLDFPHVEQSVKKVLERVGLNLYLRDRRPHELSGGQQQRACIARAMITNPSVVIHDEAVSSLDVSLQTQILNLLIEMQDASDMSYLFISHDLSAIQAVSHRVAVMYLGKIVELALAGDFSKNPLHPYSRGLKSSALLPDPEVERHKAEVPVMGEMPNPLNPPTGCPFRTRCPFATEICATEVPELRRVGTHLVACHHSEQFLDSEIDKPQRAYSEGV